MRNRFSIQTFKDKNQEEDMLKYYSVVVVIAMISSVLTVIISKWLGVSEPAVMGGAVAGVVSAVVAVKFADKQKE
jgi:energy-converting hydrogenase Eha subunit A